MKTLYITCFICLFSCLISCNQGQKKDSSINIGQQSKINDGNSKALLERALNTFTQVLIEPDMEVLDRITHDELSYGHSSGLIQNKSEFIADVLHGDFDFLNIDISKQVIIYTGDMAVVRHIFQSKALNKEVEVNVNIGVMLVWSFTSDGWKLIARQAYRLNN